MTSRNMSVDKVKTYVLSNRLHKSCYTFSSGDRGLACIDILQNGGQINSENNRFKPLTESFSRNALVK